MQQNATQWHGKTVRQFTKPGGEDIALRDTFSCIAFLVKRQIVNTQLRHPTTQCNTRIRSSSAIIVTATVLLLPALFLLVRRKWQKLKLLVLPCLQVWVSYRTSFQHALNNPSKKPATGCCLVAYQVMACLFSGSGETFRASAFTARQM